MLALACVVGACGSSAGTGAANDGPEVSSVVTDSGPGQTASEPDAAASGPGDGGGAATTGSTGGAVVVTAEDDDDRAPPAAGPVVTGAGVLAAKGFSDFSGLSVGLIASRASVVGDRSIIDVMAEADAIDLVAVFAAEHGVRADVDAGVGLVDETDPVTGLPVYSLYGSTRQPTAEMLAGIEVLFFDLQDVGTRFYTYTATMGLAMQSAAEAGIPFVVLDRPNPIGGTGAAGALRDTDQVSFVSQYPIPAIHGMTAGELALAIKGEGWLDGLEGLDLRVEPLEGWRRDRRWSDTGLEWIPPSPGLRTAEAALIYPATVLLEATTLSFGKGTDHPFQQFGAPWLDGVATAQALNARGLAGVRFEPVAFTPATEPPKGPPAVDPRYEGVPLLGVRIAVTDDQAIDPAALGVHILAEVVAQAATAPAGEATEPVTVIDRPDFFDLLAGTSATRRDLEAGIDPASIVESWSEGLQAFERIRRRYLLY